MNRSFSFLLGKGSVGLIALLLLGFSSFAQDPDGPQSSAPPQAEPKPQQQAPPAPQQKKPEDAGVTIAVEVPVVTLDVIATTSNGDIIPGLKKENFRVLEDGVPQSLINFAPSEAPITMVVLMEFGGKYGGWIADEAKNWVRPLFPNLTAEGLGRSGYF